MRREVNRELPNGARKFRSSLFLFPAKRADFENYRNFLFIAFFNLVWHALIETIMRWRLLLILSLVANVVLAVGMLHYARRASSALAEAATAEPVDSIVKTNVVLRRQFISWSHVESPDYATYIANLRSIGCPEQTIRDIIIADVN